MNTIDEIHFRTPKSSYFLIEHPLTHPMLLELSFHHRNVFSQKIFKDLASNNMMVACMKEYSRVQRVLFIHLKFLFL